MARGSRRRRPSRRRKMVDMESDQLTAEIADTASRRTSFSGEGTSEDAAADRMRETTETWDETMAALDRTRAGRRIMLLKRVNDLLSSQYLPEHVFHSRRVLLPLLASSIDKGGVEEALLACQCLNPVLATIGEDELNPLEYRMLKTSFQRVAETHDGRLRAAAASAIGLLGFLGCQDDTETEDVLRWFVASATDASFERPVERYDIPEDGFFNNAMASSAVTAMDAFESDLFYFEGLLQGWALMATRWPSEVLGNWDEGPAQDLLDFAMRCLGQNEGPHIRVQGCLCLALLLEAKWRLFYAENEFGRPGDHLAELEVRYATLLDLVEQLSGNEPKRQQRYRGLSKDERKDQRSLFRMLARTLESGEGPSKSVCLGSRARTTVLHSWVAVVRYEMFREALTGSLAAHMLDNETVIGSVGAADRAYSISAGAHMTEADETVRTKQDMLNRHARERQRYTDRTMGRRLKLSGCAGSTDEH